MRSGRSPTRAPSSGENRPAHLGNFKSALTIRSNLRFDVFGETFPLPPEAEYEYVIATVDVGCQRLRIHLGEDLIADFPYQLR